MVAEEERGGKGKRGRRAREEKEGVDGVRTAEYNAKETKRGKNCDINCAFLNFGQKIAIRSRALVMRFWQF